MAKKPETVLREWFVKKLKNHPKTFIESIQQEAICGSHDIKCCINTWYVSIEFKSDESIDLSPLQKRNMNLIERAGGFFFRVHPGNKHKVLEILYSLTEGKVLWN